MSGCPSPWAVEAVAFGTLIRHGRRIRMAMFAFAFMLGYVLLLGPSTSIRSVDEVDGGNGFSQPVPLSGASPESDMASGSRRKRPIRIFYNLFVPSAKDAPRVGRIFDEQFRSVDPGLHDLINISVNSIGHRLPYIVPNVYVREHHEEGGEDRTLRSLWDYCRRNNNHDAKVVYLHSKGSFHPDESNERLRRFLTEGALSRECASLPRDCDICSSRMSTHPHPHTPGNMWLARCDYVARLRDPYDLRGGRLSTVFEEDNGCKGRGRYFFEGWAYSHPSVRPCDLYAGEEYTWAYVDIPGMHFHKDLRPAPRFGFEVFVKLLEKYKYCREDGSARSPQGYLENRREDYKFLYNSTKEDLGKSWYLQEFIDSARAWKGVEAGI